MDPKLIAARAEIEAILRKNDIGAWVVLHNAPGEIEVFSHLTPSYSILQTTTGEHGNLQAVRILSKLDQYDGDREKQRADQGATAGMINSFALVMGTTAISLIELANTIDEAVGAEHEPLRPTTGPRH